MNIAGLVVEYNPFHNGHKIHLEKSLKTTNSARSVAVMSGNFVQRGAPAIVDKYVRTKTALLAGVDIVIELPMYYALSSAEYFAAAAVKLLDATGIVNSICFGSEAGGLGKLSPVADILADEPQEYRQALKAYLKEGLSYPKARKQAVKSIYNLDADVLDAPNNILAVEYLKALRRTGSKIIPYTIQRENAPYHSSNLNGQVSSATAVRAALHKNPASCGLYQSLPGETHGALQCYIKKHGLAGLGDFSLIFHYILRSLSAENLVEIMDVEEGLERRILSLAHSCQDLNTLLQHLKTKRYTLSRIQRVAMHILLDMKKADFTAFEAAGGPQYIRVLGFRKEAQDLLKLIEEKAALPFITNLKNARKNLGGLGIKMLEHEIRSTDIYYLSGQNKGHMPQPKNVEYQMPLVII